MKSRSKFVYLVSLIFLMFLCGCAQQTSTIDELVVHFENSGLSVQDPPPLDGREKEAVEKTSKALERLGAGSKSKLVESKTMIIDSVKVKMRRYQNAPAAQTEYENYVKKEAKKKQRSKKRNAPYNKSTYLLNGAFIIQIRHWNIKSLDDFKPTKVDVPISSVNKIKKVFDEF